jgi:DEAD/DEAH box helicase domain-containing protein
MNTRKVEDLKVEDVISVYSGKDGACCCGCSGTHSYNSAYKDLASKRRGYEVKDNEVKDREVKRILNIIKRADPKDLDISVLCYYDSETDSYHSLLHTELNKFWPIVEKADILIGYNSDHFDIPILNKYYPGDLTKIKSLDLLKEIKKSLGRRIKMDTIAEATLGYNKSGHGLEAVAWWKSGEIDKIKKYCIDDVKITKEIYDYAMANGKLKYKDFNEIKDIKLDTSDWEKKEDKTMTFTLPF